MLLRRFIAVIVMLPIGALGFIFVTQALYFSGMVLSAVVTGVFERPDFREATGDVRILQTADPDWFSGNVKFYTIVSVGLWLIAAFLVWVLLISVRHGFRTPRQ
jgi:hypothetical protein